VQGEFVRVKREDRGRDEEVGRREAIKLTETLATPSSLPPVYYHPRASPAAHNLPLKHAIPYSGSPSSFTLQHRSY